MKIVYLYLHVFDVPLDDIVYLEMLQKKKTHLCNTKSPASITD